MAKKNFTSLKWIVVILSWTRLYAMIAILFTFIDDSKSNIGRVVSKHKSLRVGLCNEPDIIHIHDRIRLWGKALAQAAFSHDHEIHFVETELNGSVIVRTEEEPDIYICLGYFYNANLKAQRENWLKFPQNEGLEKEIAFWPEQEPKGIAPLISQGGSRPFLVAHNNEATFGGRCSCYDVILDVKKNGSHLHEGCPSIYVSYGFRTMFYRDDPIRDFEKLLRPSVSENEVERILLEKTDLIATMVRYCANGIYQIDAYIRVAMIQLLIEKFGGPENHGVSSFSNCMQNAQIPSSISNGNFSFMDQVVKAFKPFKFALVFENNADDGYMTEKILNAFLADTIPVYFGYSGIRNVFNPDRFIFCEFPVDSLRRQNPEGTEGKVEWLKQAAGNELQKCIEQINSVNADPFLLKHMLMQPVFRNGEVPEDFDIKMIGAKVRSLYERARTELQN
jgi:hypothetical protein